MKAIRLLLPLLLTCLAAHAQPLVVLVDTSTEMPVADIEGGELRGGLHLELAQALAQKLRRPLQVLVMPRKRIPQALESGRADLLCMYLPNWLPGPFQWSQPFMPQTEIIVASLTVPRPASLADLAGQTVGTVLGYSYPEVEAALGRQFLRADVQTNALNLRKLALGRIQYVATIKKFYDYQLRQGEKLNAHPPFVVQQYYTRCALSPKSSITLSELDAAITQLVHEGGIARMLSNYQ